MSNHTYDCPCGSGIDLRVSNCECECDHPPESISGPPDAMFCRLCSKYVTHDDFPPDTDGNGRT